MTIKKELSDISWNVTEPEYRADPALSYSTLSKYEREGFNNLGTLFDKVSSPSLTFGSMVDTLLTSSDPLEDFNKQFVIMDLTPPTGKEQQIMDRLCEIYIGKPGISSMFDIPDNDIIDIAKEFEYRNNWKPETRVKLLREWYGAYFTAVKMAKDRTVVSRSSYDQAVAAVRSLRESPATAWYFQEDDSDEPVRRYYQLKYKATFDGVDYRCMMDLAVVDYEDKIIYPVDLKTSSHTEWDFQTSFKQWCY